MPNTRLGCQFPMRNTKWLKNGKLRKAILSAFYNISQRNLGILLILRCSFKLWWNFCLDQNCSYKGKGPLNIPRSYVWKYYRVALYTHSISYTVCCKAPTCMWNHESVVRQIFHSLPACCIYSPDYIHHND
jgi:hypothetical protein